MGETKFSWLDNLVSIERKPFMAALKFPILALDLNICKDIINFVVQQNIESFVTWIVASIDVLPSKNQALHKYCMQLNSNKTLINCTFKISYEKGTHH